MSYPYRLSRPRGERGRESVAELKKSIPPKEFYRAELKDAPDWPAGKSGWQSGGLCPFHSDRHTGSFRVHLDSGGFYCFSCAAAGGSVIDFLILRHGLCLTEALAKLRRDWGC